MVDQEQRNIVILGASTGGLSLFQYVMQHLVPVLKAKKDAKYKVYLINPSSDFYFRIAGPRFAASTERLPADKALYPLEQAFKLYSDKDFTFIQAAATGLDIAKRTVKYKRSDYLGEEELRYHALLVATGSHSHNPVFSLHADTPALMDAVKTHNAKIKAARDIIIVGGGPTSVEHAGEVGELLNGKPGWFSTPDPKAKITLITANSHLLPLLRPAIGDLAEQKLKKLGVNVVYNTRVVDAAENQDGKIIVTLSKGEKLQTDFFINAMGVIPNTTWVPSTLLNKKGKIKTNKDTTRVDEAGPRVYALGDVASWSRNTVLDVYDALPVLVTNLKRDLLAYDPKNPTAKPKGKDRVYVQQTKEMQVVPVGSAGGVGAIMGWKVPNWFVWAIKARDMMVSLAPGPLMSGKSMSKEVKWTSEEEAVV